MVGLWNKAGTTIPASTNSIIATQKPAMIVDFAQLFNFTISSNDHSETVNIDLAAAPPADYAAVVTAVNTALGEDSEFVLSYADGVFTLASVTEGLDAASENIKITTNFGRNFADLTRLSDTYALIS